MCDNEKCTCKIFDKMLNAIEIQLDNIIDTKDKTSREINDYSDSVSTLIKSFGDLSVIASVYQGEEGESDIDDQIEDLTN